LIDTLRHDPNVNVRLAAVDALKRFGNDDAVRGGIAGSLLENDSPLVQIAVIEALADLRDRGGIPALKELESAPQVDRIVRQRAKLALERIEQ
jgi:HEAT repeat protein